ncbi:unnamed protein product [Porites evermanni]|uniref:G-protein coupled receptors family 1 profile domain-containing protein n=1 Tax=Porites evermanni TaxID=104178 RepID=A0ABN8R4Y5_9CNID|nr:unnamed protein product [Porites evermanni]
MRSSTNTLVANMAVADLLMTIDIPYILKFFYVDHKWFGTFMGTVLCKFFSSAQVGSIIASVFSLVAISLDRSFAILFPVKTVMTKKVVRFAIAMIWLGALAFSLPLMVASKTAQFKGTDFLSCAEFWAPMSASTYSLVLIIGGYIIPLIIIAAVYSLAGIRLWIRRLRGHKNMISNKRAQSSSRRAIAMFITVVIVFALSWLPFQALEILRGYNKPLFRSLPTGLRYITPWFGYANSAINPILYVIFSEYYRQEFYHILCRGPSKRDRKREAVIEGVGGAHTEQLKRRIQKMCSTGISFGRSKLLQSCSNFTLKPELKPTVTACLAGKFAAVHNKTSNSTNAPAGPFVFPSNIKIGVTIFAVSIFVLALIGNSLVVYIVCTVKHMRSSTNMLIANMAFADLLMTIDIPYITKYVFVFNQWFGTFMGTVLCKFFHSAQVGSLAASVFSLVAISLDRSFAILFPMKTIMTQNVLRFTMAVVWLCALALTIPLALASTVRYVEGRDKFICFEAWGVMSYQAYIIVLLVTGYAIPLLIIALFYSLAGLRLCSRKLPGHSNLAAAKRVRSSSRSATAC